MQKTIAGHALTPEKNHEGSLNIIENGPMVTYGVPRADCE